MTRFLQKERERLNLAYVVHTGDMVQDRGAPEQWDAAEAAMRMLADIPHGVLAGNHDVGTSRRDFSEFNAHFGGAHMEDKPYCGGIYEGGMGHYDLIDAGDTRFVFAYMGYQPDEAAIRWLTSVFNQYPERVGVLAVHDYFKTDLSLYDSGRALQKAVLAQCPNVYLVLSGHRYNVAAVPVSFDDDGDGTAERTVYQMIANYQAAGSEGGSGYMRFCRLMRLRANCAPTPTPLIWRITVIGTSPARRMRNTLWTLPTRRSRCRCPGLDSGLHDMIK